MKTTTIQIPDTLTPKQELIEIVKQLSRPLLQGKKDRKRIGDDINVKHAKTIIVIERIAVEKPIETQVCSVCGTIFEKTIGCKLYTNYGGPVRKLLYCSSNCVQFMLDWDTTNRFSKVKTKLKPQMLW